jgi:hypothetical protein
MATTKQRKPRKPTYAYGEHYKPCPWSHNKIFYSNGIAQTYIPYCTNCDNPMVIKGSAAKITDDRLGALCIGRTIGGKTYRNCPYYRKITPTERQRKQKSNKHKVDTYNLPANLIKIGIALLVLYAFIKMRG